MSGIIAKNASRSSGVIGTAAAGIASLAADSSPQLGGFLDAAGNYIQMEKGGDIASASPTVIDTDGDYFAVTGTTNFSAFTVAADRHFFLEFGGALTMTHGNGTLDLPGGANITTAASDVGEFVSTAANVVTCVNYTKRDGTAVVLADNSITLAKMAGGTDGQIITYDASGDPVAVGPGTDGQVLTSTGAGSPPAFEAVAGGGLVASNTVSGAAVTSFSFTGLDLDTDIAYIIEMEILAAASNNLFSIYANNLQTATDYRSQLIQGNSTTLNGEEANNARIGYLSSGYRTRSIIHVGYSTGRYFYASAQFVRQHSSTTGFITINGVWKPTELVANVTRIDIVHGASSGFDIGTKVRIYKR